MPEYPAPTQAALDALQALTGAERKPAELVVIYWPSPAGTKIYASAVYTELPWWPNLATAIDTYFGTPIPITLTLMPDGSPFIDLPRAASVSDDSINLTFSDLDDEFSDLLMDYGEGIRCEVFGYWPTVDLLLSMWRGMVHQPKEMDRAQVKITATSGWRAPQMLVPKRPFATSCPFIFGAFYDTQAAIDQAKGCPYNAHLTALERGGAPLIGVPGFTDCPRRVKADCFERLTLPDSLVQTENYWPGFETREDPIPNNQTKGPNLLAKAIGNESALSDPVRIIAGERFVKSLYLLAFRNELNSNHPDDGFGAALFAVSEGLNLAMWEFRINGQLVGAAHLQLKLGALGQTPSGWSPDVNSYSGTAHCWGRIQGDFTNAVASDYSGSIRVLGATDVRVYSDPNTYVEGYTTNRSWWLLHVLAHLRWGYGQDYPRFDIQSFIDAATWCDEYVMLTDANGNTFSGVRSTFNAEVTARAIQQQVKDICTAGRLGIPFEFEGKDVVVPLKAEDLGDTNIPAFTDEGTSRNVIYDGAKSSLSWSVISDETMTNQWTVNFDEAANGGVDTQFIFGDQAQQLRAGRAWGDRSKRVVNKSQAGYGINSAQEAARFGNSLLYLGPLDSGGILNPFSVKFTTWYSEAFNVQNYKLIKVVNAKLQSRMAAYFTARGLEPYPTADFTYFRVMKYTRKGDLRVEIEAQQYATLDIVLSSPSCDPGQLSPAIYTTVTNLTWEADGELQKSGGTDGVYDAEAYTDSFPGSQCVNVEWTQTEDKHTQNITIFVESDDADPLQRNGISFGWFFNSVPITQHIEAGVPVGSSLGYSFPFTCRITTDGFGNGALYAGGVEPDLFFTYDDSLDFRLRVAVAGISGIPFGAAAAPVSIAISHGNPATFSSPTDFGADVDPTTGVVHLHWGPPAIHPELVTGYTLYESDGVTVAQATSYDFDADVTLTPGAYTYRVRATDGVTVSAFASVTFTVPGVPLDLTLIDRSTANTLIDRISGDTLESR